MPVSIHTAPVSLLALLRANGRARAEGELPLLPGRVGAPHTAAGYDLTSVETEAFERVEFPPLTPEPAELEPMALEPTAEVDPYAGWTKAELYAQAKALGLPGRSKLSKAGLHTALLAAAHAE